MASATAQATAWLIVAAVAVAVVLAVVGAPQSLDMLVLTGPDDPRIIGAQLAVGLGGAVATAVAVLFARYWRWLSMIGAVGVLAGTVFHDSVQQTWTVRVVDEHSETHLPVPVAVGVLLFAATGVLLVGLLGVAQELFRTSRFGAAVVGLVAAAGYYGASLDGQLLSADHVVKIVIIGAATVLTVVAALRLGGATPPNSSGRIRVMAAGAVLLSVLPTVVVAVRGEAIIGTVVGGVVGLIVLVAAVVAASAGGVGGVLSIGATGLVLAAPVITLLLMRDSVTGSAWYAWPIALLGIALGAVAASRPWLRIAVVLAATVPMAVLAMEVVDNNRSAGEVLVWSFLLLVMAAVAATVGVAGQTFAQCDAVPAVGALGRLPRSGCTRR